MYTYPTIEHMHILADLVTLSISQLEKLVSGRVSGLFVVTSKPRNRNFLAQVKWLPVTSHSYARMHGRRDKCKISIMIMEGKGGGL